MKKVTVTTVNFSRITSIARQIRSYGRWFVFLAAFTFGFFFMVAVGGMVQSGAGSSISSMKGLAAAVSSSFFVDMIGMEVPDFHRKAGASAFSEANIAKFLVQYLTGIRPGDPKSMLAREVPGLNNPAVLLRKGAAANWSSPPLDTGPGAEGDQSAKSDAAAGGTGGETGTNAKAGKGGKAGGTTPANDNGRSTASASQSGQSQRQNGGQGAAKQAGSPGAPGSGADNRASGAASHNQTAGGAKPGTSATAYTTQGRKVVFIYHSHDRESFLPALKSKGITNPDDAYDSKINVTLLGKRLARKLNEKGIGAVDSAVDYPSTVPGFKYIYSYKYSLQTLVKARDKNPDYQYFFDIHRDSGPRDQTTATIHGQTYAQVFFIIGQLNPHWKENEKFASDIHDKLEKLYPGISRGVWAKGARSGNGEYNQEISPHDILIEVGGPDNTLEECYRTIDALAKVISEEYVQAEKAGTLNPE